MKKSELNQRMIDYKSVTHDALQLIWDNIVKGQQTQLVKVGEIKALLERYGINYTE